MKRPIPVVEFVAMMALLFSTIAFATDAMLPGLPTIVADLTPINPNRAQLVISSFMLGMGLGTFVAGPLSDSVGRKMVVNIGLALFILGSVTAYFATNLETLLMARVLQGAGAAGPRIAPLAIIRDLFEGRKMAQITSFVMMVFMLVPAAAPAVGTLIIEQWNWRAIFVAFVMFAFVGAVWFNLRQSETLAKKDRRPLLFSTLKTGLVEIMSNRLTIVYTAAMTLGFAMLIAILSSTQQIYADTYDRLDSFPFWFALTALVSSTGTLLNAMLVVRIGMRKLVTVAFGIQFTASSLALLVLLYTPLEMASTFAVWFVWTTTIFFTIGLTFGNLTALALQPLGHIAGLAASFISAISTVFAVFIGGAVGQAFNGTPIPLMFSIVLLSLAAWLLIWFKSADQPNEMDRQKA